MARPAKICKNELHSWTITGCAALRARLVLRTDSGADSLTLGPLWTRVAERARPGEELEPGARVPVSLVAARRRAAAALGSDGPTVQPP
ncbi:hypothetical protein NDU88_003884 [Pleurodeles waltl]|uniref:Uncharacterized protein n=1 Tax=Pleurodeles waltl TaxID=8319 RepID=A0AAV7SH76_PLEWA|nr:hypothetical protein NDU88_003884 [Pleurodeles waltl]